MRKMCDFFWRRFRMVWPTAERSDFLAASPEFSVFSASSLTAEGAARHGRVTAS